MRKVVAYVPDMMDRSKFGALDGVVDLKFASALESLGRADADLIVADLSRPGVIECLRQLPQEKAGFFSHVDEKTRTDAVTAGVRVYTRSAFFSRLVAIITNSGEAAADTSE